ncbi:MAG: PHP domain-containing protein [Candidatus Cloacimonadales bacterium]
MRWYKADLHIHSVLSPCGSLEMAPGALMQKVAAEKIDIIAITDHNSLANCLEYEKVARDYGIVLLYGVEIQSAEEIHLIALFDVWQQAADFSQQLYDSLLPIDNDPEYFGDQVVINAAEEIVKFESKALINSSLWSFDEVLAQVRAYEGFVYPAHVDALAYSLIAQLGFVPTEADLPVLEISAKCQLPEFLAAHAYLRNFCFIRSSDAHYLQQIGSAYTEFYLEQPTVAELQKACLGKEQRRLRISEIKQKA